MEQAQYSLSIFSIDGYVLILFPIPIDEQRPFVTPMGCVRVRTIDIIRSNRSRLFMTYQTQTKFINRVISTSSLIVKTSDKKKKKRKG